MLEQRQRWLPQARRAAFELYRQEASRRWVAARGGSMRPLIAPGTWMLVEFGAAAVGVGDIVLFPINDLVVAHRLVAQLPGATGLVVKGDAEPYRDQPLDQSDLLGVVRALRRGPAGPITTWGCVGHSACMIAQLSRWSGRGAALARRAATFLPDPLRRVALRAIPPLARVAAQVLLAPFDWAARIQIVRIPQH
jgi:hypothetical protein